MQGVFISYRRQDSQSAAGRLADHLKEHLNGVPIFRDVETIEPGVDFIEAINRALRSCGVLLAVMGPRWLTVTDSAGQRRLDDANDYTRLEVSAALKRGDVRVIPVLVEGAQMPATEQLPDELKALSRRNAIELTDKRWDYDVRRLAETVRKALGLGDAPATEPIESRHSDYKAPHVERTARKPTMTPMRWAAVAAGVVVVIAGIVENQSPEPDPLPYVDMRPLAGPAAQPTLEPEPTASIDPTANQQQQAYVPPTPRARTPPAALNLSGLWVDSEGGQHQVAQQGGNITIQGMSPDGYVAGRGQISGQTGWVEYTLNGYPLRAKLEASADGRQLRVVVTDPSTGERDVLTMSRVN